jgi:hypothetical protein
MGCCGLVYANASEWFLAAAHLLLCSALPNALITLQLFLSAGVPEDLADS